MITEYPPIRIALMLAVSITFISGFITSVIVYFWVVRPYDKLLNKPSLMFEDGIPFFSALLRGMLYCDRIHQKPRQNWYDETMYGDFDFRKHSTRRQRVISRIYVYLTRLFMVSGGCMAIYEYFFFTE